MWFIYEGMMAKSGELGPMSHLHICLWQAFVEFANEETAARAMQLHREPMGSVSWLITSWLCLCLRLLGFLEGFVKVMFGDMGVSSNGILD